MLGAIALQGIRLIQPTLGEAIVVTGLGLVGLMTVQLLAQPTRAHSSTLSPRAAVSNTEAQGGEMTTR